MHLKLLYFSPTGTCKTVGTELVKALEEKLETVFLETIYDFSMPTVRQRDLDFSKHDLLLVVLPVYAGRVPNILVKNLKRLNGNQAWAIPIVVYGNRNYDDALIELKDILEACNFQLLAGAAFIGQHAFSKTLAMDRPDAEDLKVIHDFSDQIIQKIKSNEPLKTFHVKGQRPYRKYYQPRDRQGRLIDFRKIKPKTSSQCIDCKICVQTCPMGSIDMQDVAMVSGICIKCCACIKNCPLEAKYFDDEGFIYHKEELEEQYKVRKEPEIFL